jgi:hypothetical protein
MLRVLSPLGVALVLLAPLGADTILAPSSLTAYGSITSSGSTTTEQNPLPPGPIQVVLLADGDNAVAFTVATYGRLRSLSGVSATNAESQTSLAVSSAYWQDNITFESPTLDGTPGVATGSFRISGDMSATVTGGSPFLTQLGAISRSLYTFETYDRVVIPGGEVAVPTSSFIGDHTLYLDGTTEGTDFLDSVIPISFPFVYGQTVVFRLIITTSVAAQSFGSADGVLLTALANLANTVDWLGLEVVDAPEDLILVAESGRDWTQGAIPEPATLLLVGIGSAILAVLRHSRKNQ